MFGGVLERLGVVEQCRVAGPLAFELGARDPPQPEGRVGDLDRRLAHVVEDDPVVAVPVNDRGQGQLVELRGRRLDRPRGQPQVGRGVADPAQAGAVEGGVHELADPRQADGLPEVAADHRQAGRAAVHLVDLRDVREPAQPLRPLDEVPLGRGERAGLGLRSRVAGRGVDLLGTDDLLTGLGRQHLLGEVERDAGRGLVVVLRDLLLDPGLEVGVIADQPLERRGPQGQQPARRHGLDTRGPRGPLEQRQLAEEVAGAEVSAVLPPSVLLAEGAEPPLLDHVHRPGRRPPRGSPAHPAPRRPAPAPR